MIFLSLLAALPLSAVWAAPMCSLKPHRATASAPAPTASSVAATGTAASRNSSLGDAVVATTWYAGWHGTLFPPENLTWSKYSAATYAFAVTTPDVNSVSLADSDEALLPRFVSLAHQNGVKAMLTIGGWTGSTYFSSAVATQANRTAFVKTMTGLINKYDLDGLDFDWEYPNKQGAGCNILNSADSQNFLSFLQALRAQVPKNFTLTAAAGITPFAGPDGSPMADVSAFAAVLDWVAVMNYDVWGRWSTAVGPNAPLDDSCAPAADKDGSATSAVAAWTAAGFPAKQLVLGVAAYGHSFSVPKATALSGSDIVAYPAFDKNTQPAGDSWDAYSPESNECGTITPAGYSGIFNFQGLVSSGFLTTNGTAANGIAYRLDPCSQTPYVYNPSTQVMVSYDDATSFTAKGKFINAQGLLGFAMWEAAGDYKDTLLDAISDAIGIEEVSC